ncbi:MAG: helix-turn-helix domain-containing protein [Bacteroidales bacterium]|nr:helix-turn-helix domain-containing protein [Bacteroidales bacterium]
MEKLGVSRSTLWRWSQIGYLTPVKVGVSVRYKADEVDALVTNKGGAL